LAALVALDASDLAGALEAVEAGALPAVEAGLGAISEGWSLRSVGGRCCGYEERRERRRRGYKCCLGVSVNRPGHVTDALDAPVS